TSEPVNCSRIRPVLPAQDQAPLELDSTECIQHFLKNPVHYDVGRDKPYPYILRAFNGMPVPRGYKPGSEIGKCPVMSIWPSIAFAAASCKLGMSPYATT